MALSSLLGPSNHPLLGPWTRGLQVSSPHCPQDGHVPSSSELPGPHIRPSPETPLPGPGVLQPPTPPCLPETLPQGRAGALLQHLPSKTLSLPDPSLLPLPLSLPPFPPLSPLPPSTPPLPSSPSMGSRSSPGLDACLATHAALQGHSWWSPGPLPPYPGPLPSARPYWTSVDWVKDTVMKCGKNAPGSPAVAFHSPSAFGESQSSQLLHGPGFVSAPHPPAATHGPFRATTAAPAPSVPVWWASPGPAQTLLPPRPHPRPPPAAPQHTQPPTGVLSLRCGSPQPSHDEEPPTPNQKYGAA